MANGTLVICGNFTFQSIRSSVLILKLGSCNMIRRSTDRHRLCHLDPIMVINSPQRSGSTGKSSVVSRESKELYRFPDYLLPAIPWLFRKFVITRAGVLLEFTHPGCKSVFKEKDSKCQLPHELPSFGNIMSDNLQEEYAVFAWNSEEVASQKRALRWRVLNELVRKLEK